MKLLALVLSATLACSSAIHPSEDTAALRHRDNIEKVDAVAGADDTCTSVKFIHLPLSFGPTQIVHTTTSTSTETVDCGSCADVRPTYLALGVPPVAIFDATTTVDEPSVATEYVCDPSSTADAARVKQRGAYGRPGVKTITPPGIAQPTCTSQTQIDPPVSDSTSTVFPGTATVARELDCGDCEVVWSTGQIFYFAPVLITTTITVQTPSTKVELACATS